MLVCVPNFCTAVYMNLYIHIMFNVLVLSLFSFYSYGNKTRKKNSFKWPKVFQVFQNLHTITNEVEEQMKKKIYSKTYTLRIPIIHCFFSFLSFHSINGLFRILFMFLLLLWFLLSQVLKKIMGGK